MKRVYKPKPCTCCGAMFQPASGRANYCPDCRRPEAIRVRVKEAVRKWRKANPERDREQRRRWREKRKAAARP